MKINLTGFPMDVEVNPLLPPDAVMIVGPRPTPFDPPHVLIAINCATAKENPDA